MKNSYLTKVSVGFLLYVPIILAGCCINTGCLPQAKYERTVQLTAPVPAGTTFGAETHNGSITIRGAATADCNLIATIIAQAGSEEEAKKLAEQTKISLQPSSGRLTVNVEKPVLLNNQSVNVSFDAMVPNQTSLQFATHNGNVEITNITGKINAATHNGSIIIRQICGNIELNSHNGQITCQEISGDTKIGSHNGGIEALYSKNAPSVCNISIVTHNGNISLTTPPNLSAAANISTHNGSISTDLPITVIGNLDHNKLAGTIGTGQGKLYLETHNGLIKIN